MKKVMVSVILFAFFAGMIFLGSVSAAEKPKDYPERPIEVGVAATFLLAPFVCRRGGN